MGSVGLQEAARRTEQLSIQGMGRERRGGEVESQLTPLDSFGLQPGSSLLSLLERQPPPVRGLAQSQSMELMFQIPCLLTLAIVKVDLADDPESLQLYMDDLHTVVEDRHLIRCSCNNTMWQIHVGGGGDAQTRRVWCAASYAWGIKHASNNVQAALKSWLLSFLAREPMKRLFRLHPLPFQTSECR